MDKMPAASEVKQQSPECLSYQLKLDGGFEEGLVLYTALVPEWIIKGVR